MNDNTEYHIYVGLRDSQFGGEIVTENELREMIAHFFRILALYPEQICCYYGIGNRLIRRKPHDSSGKSNIRKCG